MEITRGDCFWANLNPTRGTEQAGIRPILVIQTNKANKVSPHTIIIPFTTKIRKALLPSHVQIRQGEGGLSEGSVLLCEQIRVIDKSRLMTRIGELGGEKLEEVEKAIKAILDIQ